jgi:hypothetical protein
VALRWSLERLVVAVFRVRAGVAEALTVAFYEAVVVDAFAAFGAGEAVAFVAVELFGGRVTRTHSSVKRSASSPAGQARPQVPRLGQDGRHLHRADGVGGAAVDLNEGDEALAVATAGLVDAPGTGSRA